MFASPDQHASGDFLGKCMDVLQKVYMTCNSIGMIFNWSCKDVFYRPVSETFPTIAPHYYANVPNPITFREIEQRIANGYYHNAQQFADVSTDPAWQEHPLHLIVLSDCIHVLRHIASCLLPLFIAGMWLLSCQALV